MSESIGSLFVAIDEPVELRNHSPPMLPKELGWIAFENERYQEALDIYKRALLLDPYDTECWFQRGMILEKLGDSKKALASFEKVLAIDPNHTEADLCRTRLLG